MNTEAQNQKPWVGTDGKTFSDEKLKEISRSWDSETWEQFLTETVDVERATDEVLLANYEDLLEEISEGIPWPSCTVPMPIIDQIKVSLRTLAKRQKQIIKLIFWGDLSERQVAQNLEISHQTVNEAKIISLCKIKDLLEKDPATRSYLIGGNENFDLRERSRDEQIIIVYRKDLLGSYMQ